MRMLDADRKHGVRILQLYLSPHEAEELRDGLTDLLRDPERNAHHHVSTDDMSRDISFSLVTPRKLADISRYTAVERKLLLEE